jgi:hypothetical protein
MLHFTKTESSAATSSGLCAVFKGAVAAMMWENRGDGKKTCLRKQADVITACVHEAFTADGIIN